MTTAWTRQAGTAPNLEMSRLAGAFNREWQRDYEGVDTPAPREWAADSRLAACRTVAAALVELEDHSTQPTRVDELLTALVERAGCGDPAATRVVIQYLMPCLVRVAFGRAGPAHRSPREALDELLTVAWEATNEGVDLRGRTAKIALLRTIEHRALRRPARAAARQYQHEFSVGAMGEVFALKGGADPVGGERLVADLAGRPVLSSTNAGEDLVQILAEACGEGLSRDDAQLVGSLSVGWSTCQELAASEGVTDRSVRYRRAAATRRLAEWAA